MQVAIKYHVTVINTKHRSSKGNSFVCVTVLSRVQTLLVWESCSSLRMSSEICSSHNKYPGQRSGERVSFDSSGLLSESIDLGSQQVCALHLSRLGGSGNAVENGYYASDLVVELPCD